MEPSASYGCDCYCNHLTSLCKGSLEKEENQTSLITMIFLCSESLLLHFQIRNGARAYLGSSQCSKSEHDPGLPVEVFNVDALPSLTDSNIFIFLRMFKQYSTVQLYSCISHLQMTQEVENPQKTLLNTSVFLGSDDQNLQQNQHHR